VPSASPQKALGHRAKNIEEIVPGDLVMAEDESTGKFVPKRVVQVFRNRADHLRLVSIRSADGKRDQELKTTNEHPFFVEGEGWIAANRLRPGQKVVQSDGRLGTVLSSTHEPHPEGVPVFNFEVEDVHNYFVAQDLASLPVLVHNACTDPRYARPSGHRQGVRDQVWKDAIEPATGRVRDPVTGRFMSKNDPWDMGHRPGYEFRSHQMSAAERGISREQFLNEHNNAAHYRPELPGSNRSHLGENTTGTYLDP